MSRINTSAPTTLPASIYGAYADNVCRHLMAMARESHRRLMDACAEAGFEGLKLSFGQVLPFVPPAGIRIGELARMQGVSKQAMSQLVKELEALGYVSTAEEAGDRRVRSVRLTARGRALRRQAHQSLQQLLGQLLAVLGEDGRASFAAPLAALAARLEPGLPWAGAPPEAAMVLAFDVLARHCSEALMTTLQQRGHPQLKMSFGSVITHLGQHGARINDLAEINGVTKQAVAQTVSELERLDYVQCRPDPEDGRAKRVFLSGQGLALIQDSVTAMQELLERLGQPLTEPGFRQQLKRLFRAFCAREQLPQADDAAPAPALETLLEHWWRSLPGAERSRYFELRGRERKLSSEALEALARWRAPLPG